MLDKQNISVVTKNHKRHMSDFLVSIIKKFRTVNVAESLVAFTERKRVLTSGTSNRPGPWSFERTPYLREPHECLSEYTDITEVIGMKATQVGWTELMLNWLLYCIYYGIGPVLYSTADQNLAGEHVEKRVDPMIAAANMQSYITPPVQKKGNKATGDTKTAKSYGGTYFKSVGPNSEGQIRSLPFRYLQVDEPDVYPKQLKGGGETIKKLKRRTDSFGKLRKELYGSTPKLKADSKIGPLFREGDMRYYFIPCPKCGHMQHLRWSQFKWDKNEEGKIDLEIVDGRMVRDPTYYKCENKECEYHMKDHEKISFMQEKGFGGEAEWRPTKQADRPGLRSYHISGLYGFRSWVEIAIEFEKIEGDQILLQEFMNDVLGVEWEDKIDKPDDHYLMARAEKEWVRGQIPDGVKLLSLGCDIQKEYVEWSLMGYGRKLEAWVIEHDVFDGDPNDPNDELWDKLEEVLTKDYMTIDGRNMQIGIALIDAPYANQSVMAFCERFPWQSNMINGVYPSFGKYNPSVIVREHESTIATPELLIDDQKLKRSIYNSLKRKVPAEGHSYPRGFIHFPDGLSEDYYKQLTNEEVVEIIDKRGVSTFEIHNTAQRRNEPLDTMKMALAGVYHMYIKYFALMNKRRKQRKKKEVMPDWNWFWNVIEEGG